MDDAGFAIAALQDRELGLAVARHKALFFRERSATGGAIDYVRAVTRELRLVPDGRAYDVLKADYEQMRGDGLLLEDTEAFDTLMDRCREIEEKSQRLNGRAFPRVSREPPSECCDGGSYN